MALTKASDAGLSTPASDLQDNEKVVLGTGNDLEIYHDGSHSRIVDSGTGKLMLQGSSVLLTNAAGNETLAEFTEDGAASLRFNNSVKFATTTNGSQVPDSARIGWGADDDFYITHDGTNNILRGTDKPTYIQSDGNIIITKNNGTETLAKFIPDGGVELYHNNVKKLETTAAGGTLTGTWTGAGSSGPAFRATINASTNQGLAGDTAATVEFDEETFDTDSCFDTTTHKFTPNKAGYYQVNYHVGFSASNNATSAWVYLQKNDAAYSQISQSNDWCYHMDMTSSDIVYLNGSSDSIRLRALHNSSGDTFTLFDGTTEGCYFSAVWIRA